MILLVGCAQGESPPAPPRSAQGLSVVQSPSSPPPVDLSGRIVFTRAGGKYGDETIFAANANGSEERQLTDFGVSCCPRLSHSGRQVLFAAPAPDGTRVTIAIMNTNGNRRLDVPLPTPTLNLGPGAWSPDDTRIALQGWDAAHPDRNGIYTVQADGKDLVQLTTARPGLPDVPVDYSPDGGSLLIFRESSVQSVGSLWLANVDGNRFRRLTPEALKVDIGGRWSPDGSKILFAGARNQVDGPIFSIGRKGSGLSRIFPGTDGRFGITPTWSPDGAKIMFAIDPVADSFSHPDNGLYVMNADGTALTLVIGGSDFKREPEWRR